ncbi:hypothetical protein [Mucilaginibacter lappiensis]|uniref:Uncharacterized protein n=1 Tax=Mucilaginibacter lappiensis TaxID=354630 RepID=A0A841JMY5_9SPHI|nr:hypothetical protein [Mucilaginibacter lappiensis]MBB6131794.1 hypothetical protein [Mucilaginibacter lappiensis]
MSTLTLQKTNISLLSLFCSANFDTNRIVIADHELSENFLTLYLEDNKHQVADLGDAVMYKLPISKFAEIIAANDLNSYEGTKFTQRGCTYTDRIIINEPLKWFIQDALPAEQNVVLNLVKRAVLKSSLTN